MNNVLSIVGPTATGKSNLALLLAEQFLADGLVAGVDIIAADSRQVYQGLEIISGADIPAGFTEQQADQLENAGRFYQKEAIRIFGIGMLQPDKDWSVAQFQVWAQPIITTALSQRRLPIIVGGTGLYHAQLWQQDTRLQIAPNLELREQAEGKTLLELQLWLQNADEKSWQQLNDSDRQNPRRLIRKIEIATAQSQENAQLDPKNNQPALQTSLDFQQITVGLTDELSAIAERITARVAARLSAGAVQEVERLLAHFPDQKLPVFSSTGVKPLLAYLHDEIDRETCLEIWSRQERQYAKRQLTWWRKQPAVTWFTLSNHKWQQEVLHYLYAQFTPSQA